MMRTKTDDAKERASTLHLEKILLSSSSSSSQKKIQTQSTHQMHHLHNSTDNNSSVANHGGVTGGQYTYRGVAFNNTQKNWRKLITPAHDSFKKMHQQPEFSGLGGSHVTTQNGRIHNNINGATVSNSNDTSLDTSGHNYSSVQEFQYEHHVKKSIESEDKYLKASSLESNRGNSRNVKQSQLEPAKSEDFGTSSMQMKSLMKSFSNGNFQFYENLHKKYFDKAKERSQYSSKPPTASQINLDKSEKDLFTLTSKTGTVLGLSQLKQSIDSLKTSSRMLEQQKSMMRASSLDKKSSEMNGSDKENRQQKTMSINFKNSLFTKMNANSVFLDDHSQSQIRSFKEQAIKKRYDYFDTSSSSSSELNLEEIKSQSNDQRKAIDIQQHINKRQKELLGKDAKRDRSQKHRRNDLEDELLGNKYHSMLSRRDLSANADETQSNIDAKTPREFQEQRNNKFEVIPNDQQRKVIPRSSSRQDSKEPKLQRMRDLSNSPTGVFQGLRSMLSSENPNPKLSMIHSSMLMSGSNHPDFNQDYHYQQNYADNTNIIFEQPSREEVMGDTYKHPLLPRGEKNEDLKTEDLAHMIDDQVYQSSQSSQTIGANDVLKTFQEQCKIARTRLSTGDANNIQTNKKQNVNSSQQNSMYGGFQNNGTPAMHNLNSDKESIPRNIHHKGIFNMQSAAPANRQNQLFQQASATRGGAPIQTTNAKRNGVTNYLQTSGGNQHEMLFIPPDQKSDFTFVLSNPTDFNFECNCNHNQQDSFITQKHARLLQNSSTPHIQNDLKQSRSMLRNRLPEIAASPIYSENGNLPNAVFQCHNCGGCRKSQEGLLMQKGVSAPTLAQRMSYNNLNHQSIQEESQDEDEQEHYQHPKQVFEYPAQSTRREGDMSTGRQGIQTGFENVASYRTSGLHSGSAQDAIYTQRAMNNHQNDQSNSMEEEIRFLRLLLQVSYDYMTKMLNEASLSSGLKHELANVLRLISNVNIPNLQNNANDQYDNGDDHQQQQNNLTECDGNMTMSELQLERRNQEDPDSSKQSELVVMEEQPTTGQQQDRRMHVVQKMKSSLISMQSSSQESRRPVNDTYETVYSYLEGSEGYSKKQQSLRSSHMISTRAVDYRKSLRKTAHNLTKTKDLLRREKHVNRQQEDMLKRMQAEIEALTQRWQMTEERIINGQNMYHLLSRTASHHFVSNQLVSGRQMQIATPPPTNGLNLLTATAGTNIGGNSTLYLMNRGESNHSPINGSVQHFQSQNTASPCYIPTHPSSKAITILDTSIHQPKALVDINDRLTRQIEDNLSLFDNLNKELADKEHMLLEGEVKLTEKDRELKKLKHHIKNMDESMRQLIQVTKITTEATEASKVRHVEEMDKIKKRQEDYQKKIDKIQNVFQSGSHVASINFDEPNAFKSSQEAFKQKYGNFMSKSPDTANIKTQDDYSSHNSHIHDEELSIGQIQNNSNKKDQDLVPTKLQRNKENHNPNIDSDSISFLRETNKNSYLNQVQHDTPFSNNNYLESHLEQDSSALLKYSQDVTTNSQLVNTMKLSRK